MMIIVFVIILLTLVSCIEIGGTKSNHGIISDHQFIDDMGNKIEILSSSERIISLDSTHTYNLFHIDAGKSIIGVDDKSNFPIDATFLPRYRFNKQYDIDALINAKPDLVLITPKINKGNVSLVAQLEVAGLNVVSLMPSDFSAFDDYIIKLGMLTGELDEAHKSLEKFHVELDGLASEPIDEINNVFFESNEKKYMTPARDSLPFMAMQIGHLNNIAGARRAVKAQSIDASFGIKEIIENKDRIDVYFTLESSGASIVSIAQKHEFDDIKAVKEKRVYEIPAEIINSYTFRFIDGVKEIIRLSQGFEANDFKAYQNDLPLKRKDFADITLKWFDIPTYILSDDDYYDFQKFGHQYSGFSDVIFSDEDFNEIETIAMRNYLTSIINENDMAHFERDRDVSRKEIARFLYILLDLEQANVHISISDTQDKMIQRVVDHELMSLDGDRFYEQKAFTHHEYISLLRMIDEKYRNLND